MSKENINKNIIIYAGILILKTKDLINIIKIIVIKNI